MREVGGGLVDTRPSLIDCGFNVIDLCFTRTHTGSRFVHRDLGRVEVGCGDQLAGRQLPGSCELYAGVRFGGPGSREVGLRLAERGF